MKRFPMIAAAAMLFATSATAQTAPDRFDDGDWWQLTAVGDGPGVILANGPAKRTGDTVELSLMMTYDQPKDGRIVAAHLKTIVDCTAKTSDATVYTIIYVDTGATDISPVNQGPQQMNAESSLYRYACTTNRDRIRHFPSRSRRAVTREIFGR